MRSMSTHTSIRAAKAFMMLLCGAAMLMSVGCSAGFNKQFETAKAMPIPNDDAIVGAWEGRWEDGDGHGGPLRAIVTPAGQNTYKAQFHAGYMNILTHESTVMLEGEKLGNKFAFDGTADLGWFAGGEYQYHGTITPASFHSTYDSKKHDGTYELHRPDSVEPFSGQ